MVVNLIKGNRIFSMTLPNKIKGQYWISCIDEKGENDKLISVEADSGKWVLKSNKTVSILNSKNEVIDSTTLNSLSFFNLYIKGSTERTLLFSEPIDDSRQQLRKVLVNGSCELTIGRNQNNNIYIQNKFVSGNHAKLSYDGNTWSIQDTGSTNGTYVNGYKVGNSQLSAGDYIYIMGLKIIIGSNYFAINNPDGSVTVSSANLVQFQNQPQENREVEPEEESDDYFFFRSPRFKKDFETAIITIDAPPALQKIDTVPMALMLGPSLTMGFTSLSTGLFSVINIINNGGQMLTAFPMLFMSFGMLLGTVLWPILTKKHEKKLKAENEKKRQEKYLNYLSSIRDLISEKCKEQSEVLNQNIVPVSECVERMTLKKRSLWERSIEHDDFLKLRLGEGSLPLDAEIKYPEKHFTMDDDSLQDAAYVLGTEPKPLTNVPIGLSLVHDNVLGIIGNYPDVMALSKSLIIQIAALHSYDEVKIAVIVDENSVDEWSFSRWLPHIWNNDNTERYFAENFDDAKELSAMLENEVLSRKVTEQTEYTEFSPYYVIVAVSKQITDKCDAVWKIMESNKNMGATVIILSDELKHLPRDTKTVIEVNGDRSKIYVKDDITGTHTQFKPDYINDSVAENSSLAVANIHLNLSSQKYILPSMMTFLEMFKVGKIEHLNSLTRWRENNPTITLQTPVGVDTFGDPFMLDLHEKYHGPHGLVAGMTGSGKSEFIITYILSLAVNYHPDEVAFILIDYKGGGLTGAFEDTDRGIKLPHLAGTITNLDGAAVKRSLISIQSELRRRQAIFNEARKVSNEGTMDIYKYQQLYRDKVVPEPVPHLFIISDEFAELKTQQPEFMEQLISAARIGRSLGVHLILATQKPSGVVDDQIWSNSKFRVCLKVQEKADSMDMIKCSDAAAISQTGRFYLQVGFNELFALGQSAWCGAKYVPSDSVEKPVDLSVKMIDNLGRVVKEGKPAQKTSSDGSKIKQVVAIVKYLSDLAAEEKIVERPLWLDPIPSEIYVSALETKYSYVSEPSVINPIIGEYDDPFNQEQHLLTLPISKDGNCIVYGATGNGKTTFLTTIMYSLLKHHSASYLNIYALDFGSETLKSFSKAPQVGGVMLSYENEKINNLFKMLSEESDKRKQLFSQYGGDYSSYIRSSGNIIPNIVVILNNYAAFAEQYENLDGILTQLSREGVKYGIYFILANNSQNAMRYRLLQNFSQVLTMQLNDPTDYGIIVGKTDGLIPSKFKGRGLINMGKVYEFQTAYCSDDDDQFDFINKFSLELAEATSERAVKVPELPKVVNFSVVKGCISGLSSLPVGYDKRDLKPSLVDVSNKYIYLVSSQESYQLQSFSEAFADILGSTGIKTDVIDAKQLFVKPGKKQYNYMQTKFKAYIDDLFKDIVDRNNTYKAADMDLNSLNKFEQRVIFIVGLGELLGSLSDGAGGGKDKLKAMLEKGEAIYKVNFVIADISSSVGEYSYDAWYKKHLSGSDGLWIGNGFSDQYSIKPTKMTNEFYAEIGDEFGYSVNKGKPRLVKILSSKPSLTEDDTDE